VLVLDPAAADRAIARLTERGTPAWVLGQVLPNADDGPAGGAGSAPGAGPVTGGIQGTKGVDGGTVHLLGAHPKA